MAVAAERHINQQVISAATSGPLPELTPADPDADYIAVNYYSLVPPQIVSMSVVGEWLNAATPGAARQVLDAHPELLTREGEMAHYLIADQQKEPLARDHILRKRLLLLRRARTVGADIAFDELARGTLPVSHARPIPEDPAVLQTLPQTLYALLGTSSVRETEGVLERHPELLHPVVDGMLDIAADGEPDAVRARVSSFKTLIHRAREVGVARAVLEAAIAWNAPDT